jgi:hypothetical protein
MSIAQVIARELEPRHLGAVGPLLFRSQLRQARRITWGKAIDESRLKSQDKDLVDAEIANDAFAPSARARAILRGKEIAAQDLKESGGSYSLEDVRKLFNGVSRQSIEKQVREGKLLAVLGPNNKRYYPVAQFADDGSVVEGLQAVLKALPTDNGFAILNFLVNPCSDLDNAKPIDLLKKGQAELVIQAAEGYGEQGA